MRLTIEIDDKLGEKIKQFCKLNNITYSKYLVGIIEEKFNCDRFGDLNEKLKKKKPQEEKPKLVRVEEAPVEVDTVADDIKEKTVEASEVNEIKTVKKQTRQLKTK